MKISQVTDNEIAVSDYRPLPGQMSGLGQMDSDSDLLGGLGAFDQVPGQPQGILARIRMSAKATNAAVKQQQAKKLAIARSSPVAAARIFGKAKQTAAPGSNVQRGIISALQSAAKDAAVAEKKRAQAKKLLAQGDKRGAAAASVQYLTAARTAVIKATKAEKTKTAVNLDIMAKRLEEMGQKAQNAADIQMRRTGPTPQTDRLRAIASQMAENVRKLKAQSATVQAAPDAPEGLPTPQRIAEVANKFNIRSTMKSGFANKAALVSVLADSMDSALAQTDDFDGALAYYGNDMMGRLAADIEYGNYDSVLMGLHGIDGLGAFATEPPVPGYPRAGCVPGKLPSVTNPFNSGEWDSVFAAYADCAYPTSGPNAPTDPAALETLKKWNNRVRNNSTRATQPWTAAGRFAVGLPSPDSGIIAAAAKGVSGALNKGKELAKKAANVFNKTKPTVDAAAAQTGQKPTPAPVTPPDAAATAAIAVAPAAPAAPAAASAPAAAGGMMAGKMPIIIGGVAALAVGYYFVMKK